MTFSQRLKSTQTLFARDFFLLRGQCSDATKVWENQQCASVKSHCEKKKRDDVDDALGIVSKNDLFFYVFQVVIVGNGAVGKSSMIQRYCKGIFTRNYKKTIGVDFLEKHIT